MGKEELLNFTSNVSQIGGARHYTLSDGWSRNLRGIDVNTGSGLQYTIMPDRGMDLSLASFKGINLVYLTCNGETHPAHYEPEGFGWLRTFAGGLLTTCGLTYLGAPTIDEGENLGLHGRYSTIPARQVADLSGWVNDAYVIKIKGIVEEGHFFGPKLRNERVYTSVLGHNSIIIRDTVTNFGNKPSPFMILYHINLGYPFLSEHSELIIDPLNTIPVNSAAGTGMKNFRSFIKPVDNYSEQVFCHTLRESDDGNASVTLNNKKLGISLQIRYNIHELPYLIQWKMLGKGEYVLGLEPSNVPGKNRKDLRTENSLPMLQPGESVTNCIEFILKEIIKV